ncbi:MAG: acyltransferase family protein [Pseudolabrys sp.]
MAMDHSIHSRDGRVDWVDYAKGFCIVMVVMMHSTLGVEAAAGRDGWMHYLVEFARPFRMPDFFLVSGLFLSLVIDRDWRTYLDRKVVHFAYFYVLWMTIQFAFKAPGMMAEHGILEIVRLYLLSYVEPFGTLWFIYLLPIMMVVAKLTRRFPAYIIWSIGAGLEISHVHTGWLVIDEFASRFVYFYTGYVLAPHIFKMAQDVQQNPLKGFVLLGLWAVVNGYMVFAGWSTLPFVSLALGLIGAAAVIRISALLSVSRVFDVLRYCGQHSIVIYLAFFLPMAATRTALLKTGLISDLGTVSAIVTAAGVVCPLILFWIVRNTPGRFLFERPDAFWLTDKRRPALQPAE